MKIISIDTDYLKRIIRNNIKYSRLYNIFDKYHEMPLETDNWHDNLVIEATIEYKS